MRRGPVLVNEIFLMPSLGRSSMRSLPEQENSHAIKAGKACQQKDAAPTAAVGAGRSSSGQATNSKWCRTCFWAEPCINAERCLESSRLLRASDSDSGSLVDDSGCCLQPQNTRTTAEICKALLQFSTLYTFTANLRWLEWLLSKTCFAISSSCCSRVLALLMD